MPEQPPQGASIVIEDEDGNLEEVDDDETPADEIGEKGQEYDEVQGADAPLPVTMERNSSVRGKLLASVRTSDNARYSEGLDIKIDQSPVQKSHKYRHL